MTKATKEDVGVCWDSHRTLDRVLLPWHTLAYDSLPCWRSQGQVIVVQLYSSLLKRVNEKSRGNSGLVLM